MCARAAFSNVNQTKRALREIRILRQMKHDNVRTHAHTHARALFHDAQPVYFMRPLGRCSLAPPAQILSIIDIVPPTDYDSFEDV